MHQFRHQETPAGGNRLGFNGTLKNTSDFWRSVRLTTFGKTLDKRVSKTIRGPPRRSSEAADVVKQAYSHAVSIKAAHMFQLHNRPRDRELSVFYARLHAPDPECRQRSACTRGRISACQGRTRSLSCLPTCSSNSTPTHTPAAALTSLTSRSALDYLQLRPRLA